MSIAIVGTVAFDSVETPSGKADNVLGGSATYASYSASFFSEVELVSVVGEDFPAEEIAAFKQRGINTDGLEIKKNGKTFRWRGHYGDDLNNAQTLATDLNVLETFDPKLPDTCAAAQFLMLGNFDPALQLKALRQMKCRPKLVVLDTMNLWIDITREDLLKVIAEVDMVIVNDGEARDLTGESNLVKAAKAVMAHGPAIVVIKKGEHGALLFNGGEYFSVPAYPLEEVFDPTGAGDSFAGGLVGYIAKSGEVNNDNLRRGMVYGSVMASFNVEDFTLNRFRELTRAEIEARFLEFKKFAEF